MPTISFQIQHQKHSEWCWAAVASSVSHHFSPDSSWCQCKLASEMVRRTGHGRRNCCRHPHSAKLAAFCNQQWYLAKALRIVGKWGGPIKSGRMSFKAIRKNVRAGLPVCVRIGWPDGTGHFIVITGCNRSRNGDEWLYVEDPFHGHGTWLYQEFCVNYEYAGGRWTHTFPVKGQTLDASG